MAYALIVCNGEAPPAELLRVRAASATLKIAADGGLRAFLDAGVNPDVLVGDLDSARRPFPAAVEVVHRPDQETNDLEKALDVALGKGVEEAIVLAATGLRLDQTLKNLSVLYQYHGRFRSLVFEDASSTVCVLGSGNEIPWPIGTVISLFPITGIVEDVVTEGLMYPLNHESLENGRRDGSSNVIVSHPAHVSYRTGALLLIVQHGEVETA